MYFLTLKIIKEKVQDMCITYNLGYVFQYLLPISRQALHTTWPQLRILGNLDGIFPWPYLVGDNFGKLNRNFRVHCAQWSALLRLERWSTMQKKSCRNSLIISSVKFWILTLHISSQNSQPKKIIELTFHTELDSEVQNLNNCSPSNRKWTYSPRMPLRLNDDAIFFSYFVTICIYICHKFLKTFKFQI